MAHPVVHFEIGCRDRAKTEQFFGELFGWHTQGNGPASMIDTGSQQGIPGHITALGHDIRRTELAGELLPRLVTAHRNNPLGAHLFSGQHT